MRLLFLIFSCIFSCALNAMAPKVNLNFAIDNAIKRYGKNVEPKLKSYFVKAGVSYPPKKIALLAFKQERHVQLWAKNAKGAWQFIHTYPLTAFSGKLGPKLKENDKQIPEGVYQLVNFNPFSAHHLSMMVNYPNHFDRLQAKKEGRKKLGNNIFIHGKATSIGCLAIGDNAIDQLFVLIRHVGLANSQLIIAPNDLRRRKPAIPGYANHPWLPVLYKKITSALKQFPLSRLPKNHDKQTA